MGRPDLILKTLAIRSVIILELKRASEIGEMEKKCIEAFVQMEEKQYESAFRKEGYPVVKKYAVCFFRKECMVMEG